MGGKFGDGFLSAAISAGAADFGAYGFIKGNTAGAIAGRTIAAGIVGGTASAIGGGKFSNGAWTAAFQHLLNAEAGNLKQAVKRVYLFFHQDGFQVPWHNYGHVGIGWDTPDGKVARVDGAQGIVGEIVKKDSHFLAATEGWGAAVAGDRVLTLALESTALKNQKIQEWYTSGKAQIWQESLGLGGACGSCVFGGLKEGGFVSDDFSFYKTRPSGLLQRYFKFVTGGTGTYNFHDNRTSILSNGAFRP